jgi:hypothetical protein
MFFEYKQQSNSAEVLPAPNHQNGDMHGRDQLEHFPVSDSNIFRSRFNGLHTKEDEEEHYNFLNEMRVRLNVDSQKLIDLEARITCK